MPLMDRFRDQHGQSQPETVRCPTCQEENPVGALLCQHCKGVLPPAPAESGPVTVSVTATAPTAEAAAAAVKATAAAPAPATVPCPSCGEAAPVTALVCPFCRDVLPPRPEQHAAITSAAPPEQAT